jgi:hypothetical protein
MAAAVEQGGVWAAAHGGNFGGRRKHREPIGAGRQDGGRDIHLNPLVRAGDDVQVRTFDDQGGRLVVQGVMVVEPDAGPAGVDVRVLPIEGDFGQDASGRKDVGGCVKPAGKTVYPGFNGRGSENPRCGRAGGIGRQSDGGGQGDRRGAGGRRGRRGGRSHRCGWGNGPCHGGGMGRAERRGGGGCGGRRMGDG